MGFLQESFGTDAFRAASAHHLNRIYLLVWLWSLTGRDDAGEIKMNSGFEWSFLQPGI